MDYPLDLLQTMPLALAALVALMTNIAQFALTLAAGHLLLLLYKQKPTSPPPDPMSRAEVLLAGSCVILNSLVLFAGIVLWRAGIIQVRRGLDWRVLLDVAVLFFAMDFAMYVLHRAAHWRWLFPLIHATHHRYENPRPLTLFVLNPFEVLSFGLLWIILITIYPSSAWGIVVYLTINLAFGLLGHLGVEPLPGAWLTIPLARQVSTSTFHAEHHRDKAHNFGFYTLIWDRLFRTLSPSYEPDFETAQVSESALAASPRR
jgi:sterol desaturase/sphingolipid hydroxylase (fatty acid hydroxylase superfamily)